MKHEILTRGGVEIYSSDLPCIEEAHRIAYDKPAIQVQALMTSKYVCLDVSVGLSSYEEDELELD